MTTVWTHIGNVQSWEVTPNPTIVKHKNTQGGLKRVDITAMTLLEMSFSAKLDEWVDDNVLMALLGTLDTASVIHIGTTSIRRQMKFVGANLYGPQWEIILPNVFIAAKETISFLGSDEFASLPLSGDILFDPASGAFGTAQTLGGATGGAPLTTPNQLNDYIGTGSVFTAPVA